MLGKIILIIYVLGYLACLRLFFKRGAPTSVAEVFWVLIFSLLSWVGWFGQLAGRFAAENREIYYGEDHPYNKNRKDIRDE